jgi:hypothetical protein
MMSIKDGHSYFINMGSIVKNPNNVSNSQNKINTIA